MNICDWSRQYENGNVVYKPQSQLGPRWQQHLQLFYVHHGRAMIRSGVNDLVVDAGQACLLLPGREEKFRFSDTQETHHGWCYALNPRIPSHHLENLERTLAVVDCSGDFMALARMAAGIGDSMSGSAYRDALIQAMFLEIFRRSGLSDRRKRPLHPAVDRCCSNIRQSFQEKVDMRAIARRTGVTPTHLTRLFKRELNVTPTQFLWRTRCERAATMLRETGLTSGEIAYACGFATPNHFSRLFTAHQGGVTPARFRAAAWRSGSV